MRTFTNAILFGLAAVAVPMYGYAAGSQVSVMSLDELKGKCVELAGNDQLKPFKVEISCSQQSYVWRQAADQKPVEAKNSRTVSASVHMKTFETQLAPEIIPTEVVSLHVAVYEKINQEIPSVDVSISCDDLQKIDSLATYCAAEIDKRLVEDPTIMMETNSGEAFDLCAGEQAATGVSGQ